MTTEQIQATCKDTIQSGTISRKDFKQVAAALKLGRSLETGCFGVRALAAISLIHGAETMQLVSQLGLLFAEDQITIVKA